MGTFELIHEYIKINVVNPPENITLASKLDGIGLDSLALLELMFEIEEKYKIQLPSNAPKPETVGQLIALIEKFKPS
jgi:acyl carrier protein